MSCKVGKCCFRINLRSGVIYIAYVLLVWDALSLLFMSFLAYCVNADRQFAWQMLTIGDDEEDAYLTVTDAILITAIGAILSGLSVMLDIMLLAATIKGRRKLLRRWMAVYPVAYALSLLAIWLNVKYFSASYLGLFFFLLHAGLMVYFWTVVRSYCLELGQKNGDGGIAIWTVFPGGVLPAQEAKCAATGKAMSFTAPPPYTSSDKPPLCDSLNKNLLLGGKF